VSAPLPIAVEVDARDMLCPLPVLKARKALKGVQPGELIQVLATDPAADADFKAFCEATGHELVNFENTADGVLQFTIAKAAA